MRSYIVYGLILCFYLNNGNTQASQYSYIFRKGNSLPDFSFSKVYREPGSVLRIKNYAGKWLVLDFWNKNCTVCVQSFPATNHLQEKYRDKVQYIIIGREDPENQIRTLFEKFRKKLELNLLAVFDSNLFNKFDIGPCPYVVAIDPAGIIRAITLELNEESLLSLMNNQEPDLITAYTNGQYDSIYSALDFSKPLLVDGNLGDDTDYIYRSVLTNYKAGQRMVVYNPITSTIRNGFLFLTGAGLYGLYRYAYADTLSPFASDKKNCYGKEWWYPILEVKDTTAFLVDDAFRNAYNYCISYPPEKASLQAVRKMMRRDLKNYFGYEVSVEKRMMPCINLVASEKAKNLLSTKGGKATFKINNAGFDFHNKPVSDLIITLAGICSQKAPYIDMTGFTGNVDIKLDALLTDFDDVRSAFQKQGMDLVYGQKEMRVIVIRDPAPDKEASIY